MAKKNLKSALTAHHVRVAKKEHDAKVEEAQKRKAMSMNSNSQGSKKKRRLQHAVGKGTAAHSDDADAAGSARSGSHKRSIQPFQPTDTVLLVGEGDFSFALSLLSSPRNHDPRRVLVTSFDSYDDCVAKYPTAKKNIEAIRAIASRQAKPDGANGDKEVAGQPEGSADDIVRFRVDAGNLLTDRVVRKWIEATGGANKVWFGFPHVGQGHKDETRNVLANQLLLLRFMVCAARVLSSGPKPSYVTAHQQAVGGSKGKSRAKDDGSGDEQEKREDIESRSDDGSSDYLSPDEEELEGELGSENGASAHKRRKAETTHSWWPPPRSAPRAGSLLITLREAKPYTLWSVSHLGTRLTSMLPAISASAPALPKGIKAPTLADVDAAFPEPGSSSKQRNRLQRGYDVWRSFVFRPSEWSGYRHVRTIGSHRQGDGGNLLAAKKDSTVAANAEGADADAICRTWEFGVRT